MDEQQKDGSARTQIRAMIHGVRVRALAGTFFAGFATILPIFVTVTVVLWMIGAAETVMGGLVRLLVPGEPELRGMGLVAGIALTFAVGVLMQAFFFRRLVAWLDGLMNRIPIIKTVYGPMRDLTDFFSKSRPRRFSKVVLVNWPGSPASLIGFVTVEDAASLPVPLQPTGQIAVYIPMSYQIGGFTVFLPRDCLTPLDMSFEDAMRFVVTAGMSRPDDLSPPAEGNGVGNGVRVEFPRPPLTPD